jgi:hypothetical protein
VYRPVPTIIEAATAIMAGTKVEAITRADAENMDSCARRVSEIIREAKASHLHALVLLTGVPGSGKTLAGLKIVQREGLPDDVEAVYLSGNTPLVNVLQNALAEDEHRRRGVDSSVTKAAIRRQVKATIQHVNDFLKDGRNRSSLHERVIVFDEAQRAWDADRAPDGFERGASEPALILDLVSRAAEWSVCVCLLGTGQEIGSGEEGLSGWVRALNALPPETRTRWRLYGDRDTIDRECRLTGDLSVRLGTDIMLSHEPRLQLRVSLRQFRCPRTSEWVSRVLESGSDEAQKVAAQIAEYPLLVTRSLDASLAARARDGFVPTAWARHSALGLRTRLRTGISGRKTM